MNSLLAVVATLATLIVAITLAVAGSVNGRTAFEFDIFAICIAVAFVIQWIVFIPSSVLKSEKAFDMTGSITFLSVFGLAAYLSQEIDLRVGLITVLVGIWAIRRGSFLTRRGFKVGHDRRFNPIRNRFFVFFMTWTLQGLWISLTSAAALAAVTSELRVPVDGFLVVGVALWLTGFVLEVLADAQKESFRKVEGNRKRFINTGLWAWSQHPNYFGEILLWIGIAMIAYPVLSGWQYVTLVSPVFVWLLLTKISGVRMLDTRADRIWADDPDYHRYKKATPVLLLKPPRVPDASNS